MDLDASMKFHQMLTWGNGMVLEANSMHLVGICKVTLT